MNTENIQPGYIEPETHRVAITVEQFYNSKVDDYAYWFYSDAKEFDLDPWRIIESLDKHLWIEKYDVWFLNGTVKEVYGNQIIFVTKHCAESIGIK